MSDAVRIAARNTYEVLRDLARLDLSPIDDRMTDSDQANLDAEYFYDGRNRGRQFGDV